MALKKHTGFTDADVDGVSLNSDGTNFQKDATNKILDDGNAQFSDIQDVNIPTDLTQADDGKVIAAVYEPPAVYGDEADGALVATSAGQIINVYTDLTADVNSGSAVLTVRSTTGLSTGDELLVHQIQNYREDSGNIGTVGAYEFVRILTIDSGTQLTLTTGVSRNYLSDSNGDKAAATKTQLVRVPNYSSVTSNSPNYLSAKAWDGYSGGVLVFRATTLSGDSAHSVSGKGYRGTPVNGGASGRGEGNDGLGAYNTYPSSAGSGKDGNPWGGGGGGHNGAGTAGGGGYGIAGSSYGRTNADLRTYLTFGGGGCDPNTAGDTGGSICIYAGDISAFSGSLSAVGGKSSSGGSVLIIAPTNFTGTISVNADTSGWGDGAVGYSLTGQPTVQPTKEYTLGSKVVSSYSGATSTDILTKTAVDAAIAAGSAHAAYTVDLALVAQTGVYTVPTGKIFVINSVEAIISAITGAAAMPTVRWGTTASPASILAAVAMDSSMNAVNAREAWEAGSLLNTVLSAGDTLEFGVTVAGTSTTHKATVFVRGILLDA